ncbi:MAG: phosphodiesterase [Gammaproteobacteria bacterium]
MLIAQITDTHIKSPRGRLAYKTVDTVANLERCVAHVMALEPQPDLVLMTGDLTDFGRPEEYRLLRELIRPLSMPVYLIPGNHDERGALLAAFVGDAYLEGLNNGFVQYTVENYPVRLIGLDTVIPGDSQGTLCSERLAWLDARLNEQADRPTVLFMHHPPFKTGIDAMDRQGFIDAKRLGALVERHPQVQHIICGHVHRPIHVQWHGVTVSVGPSASHYVALDLAPAQWPHFYLEPPSCQLYYWLPGTGLIAHTSFVGSFEGPYPFFDDHGTLID